MFNFHILCLNKKKKTRDKYERSNCNEDIFFSLSMIILIVLVEKL